jgi:hypothetical protein
MKRTAKLTRVMLATALSVLCGHALGAPHLEPCNRLGNGYEERVERLLRDTWPEEMEVLAIMYVPLTERGIGLARDERGFNLIRLEFDKSFWYSSWRRVEAGDVAALSNADAIATEVYRQDGAPLGAEILDFARTQVRVAKASIPIGDELGTALIGAFDRGANAARIEDDAGFIVTDGYKFEILLAKRPCVELRNPPPGSDASEIADLVRVLDSRLTSWRSSEPDIFETEVRRVIPD